MKHVRALKKTREPERRAPTLARAAAHAHWRAACCALPQAGSTEVSKNGFTRTPPNGHGFIDFCSTTRRFFDTFLCNDPKLGQTVGAHFRRWKLHFYHSKWPPGSGRTLGRTSRTLAGVGARRVPFAQGLLR